MSKEEMSILKIEELLKDENKFNSYLDSLENNNDIPYEEGLENRILSKITNEKNDNKKQNKFRMTDYLKVACFTLIALIIWNFFGFVSKTNGEEIESARQENSEEINSIISKINEFFVTPINLERGGK